MDRGATPEFIAGIAEASVFVAHLVEIDFNPVIYLTDAGVDVTWNGNVYLASQVLQVGDISEQRDLLITECQLSLSGVDQAIIALLLQDTYLGRTARVRKALLAQNLTTLTTPVTIIDGRMDRPVIATDPEAGTCTASVTVISRWSPLQRPAGRHTNDAEQQALFPGDLGFNQVTDDTEEIVWGGVGYKTPTKRLRR